MFSALRNPCDSPSKAMYAYGMPCAARSAAIDSDCAGGPTAAPAAETERFAARLARLGQPQRGRHRVGHVHDPPLAAQPLAVGPAVPARAAVVHVDDSDAAAGEVGLLQVMTGDDLRGRT